MSHTFLNPHELLPPLGFSHIAVVEPGRVVHIAGQTAHQRDGSVRGETIAQQMDAALANLVTALAAADARPRHLVAMQIFVTDVAEYRASLRGIGEAWRGHLGQHFPAISLLGVNELFDPHAKIEIVATAVVQT